MLFVLLDFETWNNCNICVNILDPDYVAVLHGKYLIHINVFIYVWDFCFIVFDNRIKKSVLYIIKFCLVIYIALIN